MSAAKHTPKRVKDGITFWPIPAVKDADIVFGAAAADYFDRYSLPEVPPTYINEANRLFFSGGALPALGDDVDKKSAVRWLRSRLSSFQPPQESKEATVAYALWVWAPESAEIRAAIRKATGEGA